MARTRASTLTLTVRAPLRRADLPGLYARLCRLLVSGQPARVVCDVSAFADADAVAVDALARLRLAARRHGAEVRLLGASAELRQMLELTGLDEVLPDA